MKKLFAVAVLALSTLTAGSVSSKTYEINLSKAAKVGNTQRARSRSQNETFSGTAGFRAAG